MIKIISIVLLLSFPIQVSSVDIIASSIPLSVIRNEILIAIFTKSKMFWNSGEKITVYIKPINSLEHLIFVSEWLGISAYRYKKLLENNVYSGNSSGVIEVNSDEAMLLAVYSTPNSIGYLNNGTVLYYNNSYINNITVYSNE